MDNVKDKTNNKTLMLIIGIVLTILIIGGGTLAYWSWETNETEKTAIQFTVTPDFSCSVDGGQDINQTQALIAPTTCTNSTYAIKREITVGADILDNNVNPNINVNMNLWIEVNSLGDKLKNSENFRYALTTSDTSCEVGVVSSGNLNGLNSDDTKTILKRNYGADATEKYYLWIWLDAAEEDSSTMNQSFSLELGGECTNTPSVNHPVLDDGMIPVTIENDGTVTTVSSTDDNWYNYNDKKWANVVLVKENKETDHSRGYYKNNPGVVVSEDDILAYYVWIPRYKYRIPYENDERTAVSIDIEFEAANSAKAEGNAENTYYTHPAFWWDENNNGIVNDGETIAGIWVGKFEASHSSGTNVALNCSKPNSNCTTTAAGIRIKPNVSSLRNNAIIHYFNAVSILDSVNNPFGLNLTQTDSHLMKNSEWGAVAYLSHSIYGINAEIEMNMSSEYKTGYGSSASIKYGNLSYYPQSTTGNISGIFDMSGGAYEYVMGALSTASGISDLDSKYYDLYAVSTIDDLCANGICKGHALFETAEWYNDAYLSTLTSSYSWFVRGGYKGSGNVGGSFSSFVAAGNTATDFAGFRPVAVVSKSIMSDN